MDRKRVIEALEEICENANGCVNCVIEKVSPHGQYCVSHQFEDMKDADLEILAKIAGVNVSGEDPEPRSDYWGEVCRIQKRQTEKGLEKYGQRLEDNVSLSPIERLEYLEEELIDGLMYIEHIKALLRDEISIIPIKDLKKARDQLDKLIQGVEEVSV